MSDRLDLRLIVITDAALAAPRSVDDVVLAALAAGAPAIQLRDKRGHAAALLETAARLRILTRRHRALLFVNDRLDVALAADADGVHLGPTDLPVAAARRLAPSRFLIGFSTDDPELARAAADDGADYIGCGAVFGTSSKPEATGEQIGTVRLREVVEAVPVPVVGIGGVTPDNAAAVAATGAAGAAVIGAVMSAPDPASTVAEILLAFDRERGVDVAGSPDASGQG
ncbi:MAG: thiamine phosphate synthase [Longimicrobiales bacterium]